MVKCPRCGYENDDGNAYCLNCTYPLDKAILTKKRKNDGWNISTAKKVLIVIGIIAIALVLFSIIQEVTKPSPESSLNIVTANESDNSPSSTPFEVVISYDGDWYGRLGDVDHPSERSGSGNQTYRLSCAGWDEAFANIQKTDYGSGELKVQLLKNGKVISENSTTAVNGGVSVHV